MSRNPKKPQRQTIRCAIYTRKSSEEGLELEFNSLDAQREAAEAYIASQKAEGWMALPDRYDDGGYSGGSMERPALDRLLRDIDAGKIDCVVVYKVDRLSRSLMDFARIMETFDRHRVSFVSVIQHFNTTHSMGRLTLNILLSFAQFEREIIGERIRDKLAAQAAKNLASPPALLSMTWVVGIGITLVALGLLLAIREARLLYRSHAGCVSLAAANLAALYLIILCTWMGQTLTVALILGLGIPSVVAAVGMIGTSSSKTEEAVWGRNGIDLN